MSEFIELLKKYRFDSGDSREELAKKLGVAAMTIYRWEVGTSIPEEKEQKRIQNFINSQGTYLDPCELLAKEIVNLQRKLDSLLDFLITQKTK